MHIGLRLLQFGILMTQLSDLPLWIVTWELQRYEHDQMYLVDLIDIIMNGDIIPLILVEIGMVGVVSGGIQINDHVQQIITYQVLRIGKAY